MAKPNSKLPAQCIDIQCAKCRHPLYRYAKGGKGSLVKCFIERIVEDHTRQTATCPECQQVFGREAMIRGVPAIKIIAAKVRTR